MKMMFRVLVVLVLVLLLATFYPGPTRTFDQLYPQSSSIKEDFERFRTQPLQQIKAGENTWSYLATGSGAETLLFLHGMGGAYDIWWQQIEALQDSYRILAPTYPAVSTMEALAEGVIGILNQEGVSEVHLIGSSLGGDLAQYLAAYYPERVKSAVFGNTFVADRSFRDMAAPMFAPLRWAPEWLIRYQFRKGVQSQHYPASGNSDFLRAYLLEQGYGAMEIAQFKNRALCVLDIYDKRLTKDIPLLIIESDNDPLVPEPFRAQVKTTYPGAAVYTFSGAGHFPYLSHPDTYTRVLIEHLNR